MNPWAHIDELKKKHQAEIDGAVSKLIAAGYDGNVKARLDWNGMHWSFPVSGGDRVKARTLAELVTLATARCK